jgi:tRNA(adenine34) deaminase
MSEFGALSPQERETHETFMALALEQAQLAADLGEVPVGALVVSPEGDVLSAQHNRLILSNDPTAHAEVLALREAASKIHNYRLVGCSLYVTLEPCTMCCGALVHARVEQLYFGALEPKAGAVVSTASLLDGPALNHRLRWQGEIMAGDSTRLLKAFFAARR